MLKKLLHVGCGYQTIQNLPKFKNDIWQEIRFDIDPNVLPDAIGSLTDMSNIEDSSIDAIYSSHNIEHIYPHEVHQVFCEFLRILKPSGFAIIYCPDLASVAQGIINEGLESPLYISPAGPITPLDILYGHIDSLKKGNLFMAHRTGFTWGTLKNKLHSSGFPMIYGGQFKDEFALKAIAFKSMHPEEFAIYTSKIYL